MSMEAVARPVMLSPFEQLWLARQVLLLQSQALTAVADRLNRQSWRAVEYLDRCQGSVVVSGIGRADQVGQTIMATPASTATRSHYLYSADRVGLRLSKVDRHKRPSARCCVVYEPEEVGST